MKKCIKCLNIKPLADFVKRKSAKDGRRGECKSCANLQKLNWITPEQRSAKNAKSKIYKKINRKLIAEKNKTYKVKNKLKIQESGKRYYSENKDEISIKNKKHYELNKARIKEYFDNRKHLKAAYDADYNFENKEKISEQSKKWKRLNPEKVSAYNRNRRAIFRKAKGTHSAEDVIFLLNSQKGLCVYCKSECSNNYHVDHIQPLIHGGSNWPENLQILCPPCNLSKGAKCPIEFAQERGMLL